MTKIMVVDDENNLRELIKAVFEQEGFDVDLSSRSLLREAKTSTILLGELRLSRRRA
mgnify:CR=1 FL=1